MWRITLTKPEYQVSANCFILSSLSSRMTPLCGRETDTTKMNSKDYLFCYRTQNFYTWLNLTETKYFIPSNTYNMKNSKIFVCTYMDLSSYTTHLHNDGSSICGVSACTRMWVYQLMNYVLVDLRILLLLQISMSKLGIIYKSVSTQ